MANRALLVPLVGVGPAQPVEYARSHMTMVNLALMAAEGLGKRLDPMLSLTDPALPYLAEALAGTD
jgi:hypothetical protein